MMEGIFEFTVRGYECGPDETATLPNVMNYLQEAAGLQAMSCGFSRQDFESAGLDISWVLTRFHVHMLRYPRWEECVRVTTWPCNGNRIVVERDFELRVGDELIGRATSEWVLIDLKTRKLASIPPALSERMDNAHPRALPDHAFPRLRWECTAIAPDAARFRTRRGDLDINGHVNNVHYVEWLVEILPDGSEHPAKIEIAYKSETPAGEEVLVESVATAPDTIRARVASASGGTHVLAEFKL